VQSKFNTSPEDGLLSGKLVHLALPVRWSLVGETRGAVETACTYDIHPRGARLLSGRNLNLGDLLVFHPVGAYNVTQSMQFITYRPRVVLVTECSMSDNVAVEHPDIEFVRPCNLCPHMKRITLEGILHSLETMTVEVTVDAVIAKRAKASVDRMLAVGTRVQSRLAA